MSRLLTLACVCGALGAAAIWASSNTNSGERAKNSAVFWAQKAVPKALSSVAPPAPTTAGQEASKALATSGSGAMNKCVASGRVTYTDAPCPAGSRSESVATNRLTVVPPIPDAAPAATEPVTATAAAGPSAPSLPTSPFSSISMGQDALKQAMAVQGQMNERAKTTDAVIEKAGR